MQKVILWIVSVSLLLLSSCSGDDPKRESTASHVQPSDFSGFWHGKERAQFGDMGHDINTRLLINNDFTGSYGTKQVGLSSATFRNSDIFWEFNGKAIQFDLPGPSQEHPAYDKWHFPCVGELSPDKLILTLNCNGKFREQSLKFSMILKK